ncbi:MAG TPA: hypothetical protein VGR32_04130 [Brevundimonas sp.]|jgi:hypothetical protein|uniref:hypothetical protein n=1 Tax=Brevundimonas sp. TaxID=1871086 RepID=UPI002DF24650|nr:hypothetical protein [Brevundimonas sp.]
MKLVRTATALVAVGALVACASTPRGFAPVMSVPPEDAAAFQAAFDVCGAEVAAGRRENFREGRGGSAARGLALGGAAALVTGASAASGAGMLAGVAGGVGLAAGLVVFAPLAMFGVSRMQRAHKEREITAAMSACLAEEGYVVEDWRLMGRGETGLASPTAAPRAAAPR